MAIRLSDTLPIINLLPPWLSIFNTFEFFNLHKTEQSIYLTFLDESKIIGVCHFTEIETGIYKSPYRGTFGGIEFKNDLDLSIKNECVILLNSYFIEKKAKKVICITAPSAHSSHKSSSLRTLLLHHGFSIAVCDINHSLLVDQTPLIEKMMRNNKKRLKKCVREHFDFKQVFSIEEYEEVYNILAINRTEKGVVISMTFKQIMEMLAVFPDKIYFFKTSFNNTAVATSICIKITSSILYVFYWGDIQGYEQYSPVVHLANGIYEFAQQKQFEIIDVGTSSLQGEPNYGLSTFKENLGFTTSSKITYIKNYLYL